MRVAEVAMGKVWQVSTAEVTKWLEDLNTTNLALLVVGNSFFNSATGWHDIRVYRFARAFEALGFKPLVMCRWTSAATEVAGTYDGIAFCRLTRPAHCRVPLVPSSAATVAAGIGENVADPRLIEPGSDAETVVSQPSESESDTGAAVSACLDEAPQNCSHSAYRWARELGERLGVRESARPAWRFIIRLSRAVTRLSRAAMRLARAVLRLPYRVYRLARIARSRILRVTTPMARVARNRTVRTAKWFVTPWVRYLNLPFSRDFRQVTQSLRPCFIYAADLNTLPAASRLARCRSVPLVYDSHEYFLSHSAHYWMSPVRRIIDKLTCRYIEARLIPRAHRLISVSEGLVHRFSQRFPTVNCMCVRNLPLTTAARPRNDRIRIEKNIAANARIALYIGYITGGRGVGELLQAATHLPDDIVIVFLGGGRHLEMRRREAVDRRVENRVYFLGHVPQDEVQSYAAAADCGLSLIQPTCVSYYHSLPNKMFQYAASGTPIVCSDFPDMASLVKRYDMGAVCDPTNPRAISSAIVRLLSDPVRWKEMSANGLRAARTELNWEAESRKLSFCGEFTRSHT